MYACMLGFCRTLEIIARTLREVVNRVRLCGHHTRRSSCVEVHVVVRLFVCLFVWIKPELLYFAPCVWREVITPGNGCTWNQAQTTCVTLRQRHRPPTYQLMANTLQVDGLEPTPVHVSEGLLVCLFAGSTSHSEDRLSHFK